MDPQPVLPSRYTWLRELGHGGNAVVHLAFDREHMRLCAVKVLAPESELGRCRSALDRLIREAAVYRRLVHPHILALHHIGLHEGRPYLVTDYAEGGSLAAGLKLHGRLPLVTTALVGTAVAAALGVAHEAGIVHRDVKPANVLLSTRGVLLGDFGIASTSGQSLTRTGTALGTLGYVSPEQLEDPRRAGPPADIYSLGATLFAASTGRPVADLYMHGLDRFLDAGLPDRFARLLHACTRRRPTERPRRAVDVADHLRELVGSGALGSPDESPQIGHLLDGSGVWEQTELQLAADAAATGENSWRPPPAPTGLGPTVVPKEADERVGIEPEARSVLRSR